MKRLFVNEITDRYTSSWQADSLDSWLWCLLFVVCCVGYFGKADFVYALGNGTTLSMHT